jgi:hypothetical protein
MLEVCSSRAAADEKTRDLCWEQRVKRGCDRSSTAVRAAILRDNPISPPLKLGSPIKRQFFKIAYF